MRPLYLGSILDLERGVASGIRRRIGVTQIVFSSIHKILSSPNIQEERKLKLPQINVNSVLLRESKTWKNNRKFIHPMFSFKKQNLWNLANEEIIEITIKKPIALNQNTSGKKTGQITKLIEENSQKKIYLIWSETTNIASRQQRMESTD